MAYTYVWLLISEFIFKKKSVIFFIFLVKYIDLISRITSVYVVNEMELSNYNWRKRIL